MATIAVLGTMDTKGREFRYLADEIERLGGTALLIDASPNMNTEVKPDFTSAQVAAAAGVDVYELQKNYNRERAQTVMGEGSANLIRSLLAEDRIQGFISMGGSQGANIAAEVMRKLPFGFPKLLISTQVCVDKRQVYFEGCLDMFGVNPTTDVAGLNSIMRTTLSNAAAAISGMAANYAHIQKNYITSKKRIGISMLGVTTPCVNRVAAALEEAGYEVLVFHATGFGGNSMERMIRDGEIQAVVDVTTSELSCQYVGHDNASESGTPRLTAAAEMGIPQIVVPGGMDHVNFMKPIPAELGVRIVKPLNKKAFSMRTNAEENAAIGKILAERVNESHGKSVVMLPLKGLSRFSVEGDEFYQPEADASLFQAIRENLNEGVKLVEIDCNINDPEFAERLIEEFEQMKV